MSTRPPSAPRLVDLSTPAHRCSPGFAAWLSEQQLSILFTLPAAGRLCVLSSRPNGALALKQEQIDRPLSLAAADSQGFYLATRYQIWRFQNALPPGERYEELYDRLYLPRLAYTTGNLGVHDLGLGAGEVFFINALYNCLASADEHSSFAPRWLPPFISRLALGNRCHLSGLAMRDGRPAYVTSLGTSDQVDGWRQQRAAGGALLDVEANAVVLDGLSMPHSPELHAGRLWLANGGRGELGWADLGAGRFEPTTFLPGLARGLALHGDYALVGCSRPRDEGMYAGLPIHDLIEQHQAQPQCGIFVVDLRSGEVAHWLVLDDDAAREIVDLLILERVARPLVAAPGGELAQTLATVAPFDPV